MKKNKQVVPKRRFKEFENDGEWGQKKLGDLGSVAMNKRIFKDQTSEDGDIPFYKIGTFGREPDAFMSQELFEEYKSLYSYPEVGDILISASGSIGRTVEYTGEDEYFQDSNIVWLNHGGRINNLFLKQFYEVVEWEGLEGSTIKRLYNSNILDTELYLPSLKEQKKIGLFFSHLDEIISLQENKLDKIKMVKHSYLLNMFPNEGEKYPKKRFEGFTEPWKECILKDLGDIITGSTPSTKNSLYYSNDGIPWVTPTDISENITYDSARYLSAEGQKVARVVPKDTVLITSIASIGKNTILGTKGSFNQQINALVPNKTENNAYFLFIQSILWSERMKNTAASGTMQIVNKTQFSELKAVVPSLDEQIKIGKFFKNIDAQINLEEQKLNKLEQLKQAYLNELFV